MPFIENIRRLIIFELKHSMWYLLLFFGLSLTLLFLMITGLNVIDHVSDIKDNLSIFSTLFIYIVLIFFSRPAIFRTQNLGYNFRVCEHLVHLQQLPLKKSMIITYRLIVNYVILIPLFTIYLVTLYIVISPLRELLPPFHFIVFAILWLMIGIIILNIQTIMDFGTNILFSYIYLLALVVPIAIIITFIFNNVIEKNFYEIMVYLSIQFPIQSFIISILLILLSIYISYHWCLKRMSKIDYLL